MPPPEQIKMRSRFATKRVVFNYFSTKQCLGILDVALSDSLWLSLARCPALSGLLGLSLAPSGSLSCSLWPTLALSGSLWLAVRLSQALSGSPNLLTKPLLGSQGPCLSRSVATALQHFNQPCCLQNLRLFSISVDCRHSSDFPQLHPGVTQPF